MDKNQFQDLLKAINEAYDPHTDPRNAFFPMDKLQPWERLVGGDVHEIPGGKEAWEKEQAAKAAKPAEKKEEKKKLAGPKGGNVFAHIDSNAFGLDDAAHAKAKELVSALRKSYTDERPGAFQAIHDHLADSGVDTEDLHMKSLMASADEAAEENYEKSRSRAGL